MKKIFLFAIIVSALTTAQAQFGVKAGLNMANLGGDDVDDEGKKSLMGFHGGIFYNIVAGESFSVQPELVYSAQGAKYEFGGISAKFALNYLNFTPLLRYNSSGFFVGVGPQIGFLMSAKTKADGADDEDVKDQLKSVDFAAAIAAGYEFENGFGFYGRFNYGLSSISEDSDEKVFNRVFQIGLRYSLKPSK
jgi:hypothetical protein